MPSPSRRDQARLATRQTILEEARKLFAARGYDAVTMRDIARATQYTASALYYHFQDKAELMRALCLEDFLGLASRIQAALTSADPLENLKNLGQAYARFALEFPNHYRLMFMTHNTLGPAPGEEARIGDPNQDAYAGLLHLVTLAMDQGRLRPELTDPHLVAQTYWGGIHGAIALQLDKGFEEWVPWTDVQARIDLMCEVLRRGFARS